MKEQPESKYYLFIDECGDQNLANFNPTFPVFTLCGVIVPADKLPMLERQVNDLKLRFCDATDVILHSREIRKCRAPFSFLQEQERKQEFYEHVNRILSQNDVYVIVSCTIIKEAFIQHFSKDSDVYGLSLYYLLERSIFYADDNSENPKIDVIVEKRGKLEDRTLLNYYNKLRRRGTKWVSKERFQMRLDRFSFKNKKENVIGLQLADLIAYPIARYVIDPSKPNPAFDVIRPNIFFSKGALLGMKIKPN